MAGHRRQLAFGERGRFLRALAHAGDVKAAAAMAGIERYVLYRVRGRDAGFAAAWDEALAAGRAARTVIARGRDGIQAKQVLRRQFTPADAARAVAVAAETGSLKSVAARIGFCLDTIRKQRRGSPGFDAAIRAALADATVRLEAELLDRASAAMAVPCVADLPVAGEPVRFAEALDLVKHRRAVEAREARQADRGRRGMATAPDLPGLQAEVLQRIEAIRRARGGNAA